MEPTNATTPGIGCDNATRLLASESMLKRLTALAREVDGVRKAEDPECIHRIRVASRRVRTALELFGDCFPQRRVRSWRKAIRRITRCLGVARDKDVQIEFVGGFMRHAAAQPKARPGLARLLLRLQQERCRFQVDVCKALDRFEQAGVIEDMTEYLLQVRVQSRLGMRRARKPSLVLLRRAYLTISLRLEELLAFEPSVDQPQAHAEHHAMRIAAKHLRYAMEIFQAVQEEALAGPVKLARECQTLLGDIHDCDVWVEQLPAFLDQERERTVEFQGTARGTGKLQAGIDLLLDDRKRQRDKLFGRFQALWKQAQSEDVWRSLIEALASPLEAPAPAAEPAAARAEAVE